MNPYFVVALAGGAYLIWECYKRSETAGAQKDTPADSSRLLRHYAEPDGEWSNPTNLTTDPRKVYVTGAEEGPFGVDRVFYEGPGHSVITLHGSNYSSI